MLEWLKEKGRIEKKRRADHYCAQILSSFIWMSSRRSLFHFSVLSFFIHSITYIFHYFWRPFFNHYHSNRKMRCNLPYHHWVDLLYFLSLLLEEETMDLYTIFIYYSLFLTIRTLLKISYKIRSLFLLHYIHIIIHVNAFCKSSLAS